ncbi:MAG TPA: hypothetical protein VG755_40265 [Nannocystaceae bacterium]|nr:hypothetical protein [Nannocystaceae bacterium]
MSSDAARGAGRNAGGEPAAAPWLRALVIVLGVYRALYHLVYLRDDPFAVATVSDGRVYEDAAIDVLRHWPLGSEPFYLQGLYVYQLAIPMFWGRLAFALLLQLAIVGVGWWLFARTLSALLGARAAVIALVLALAIPALAFYENKFLSAALTVDCSIALLAAWAWVERGGGSKAALACGLAGGLCVLARPNLLLALPFVALALWWASRRWLPLACFAIGIAGVLAPMAMRNAVVTGEATVFPAHGGGTSFYIGNNAKARGVWNPGAVFTGDVSHELDEHGGAGGGSQAERMAEMGRDLYARAWRDIADDPGRWLWLECRKLWLLLGNDELAQDFDVRGERELIPWAYPFGLPFGLLLALAAVGVRKWWRARLDDPSLRARLLVLAGLVLATVAANLVFFTSSQHRLPLAIPLLPLAAVGVVELVEHARDRSWLRAHRVVLAIAGVLALQAMWPRTPARAPSIAHYYNLAIAYDRVGEPAAAMGAADRAVELAPQRGDVLIERASLRRRAGDFAGAAADLERLATMPDVPEWIRERARFEARMVAVEAPPSSFDVAPRFRPKK